MKKVLYVILGICLAFSCKNPGQNQSGNNENIIGKKTLKLQSDIMTPEVLWSFGRISGVDLSPDKSKILYNVKYYSIPENKGNSDLFVMNTDGSNVQQITKTTESEYDATWKPDGSKIAYLSTKSGSMQLWEMDTNGENPVQISDVESGINAYKYSPDLTKILYTKEVKLDSTVNEKYPDLDKANAKVVEDIMYRHWDSWVETYSHIFVANYDGQKLSNDIDILENGKYDSPLKPFGGIEQVNWSPNSKNIININI